ncbi:hypothetical protein HMPREF2954_01320 [Neisseria sp. HMSC067H09]|nr:hypothetical protein HMPREF2568_06405 [Neisseria sp. HMSC059F02]OFS04365.1 hypothetical protein HMPREF2954_01320 [Neisseria sp. HMSC067H09]OFT18438.1 hypothetical protein HMPREF3066_10910 [Neisseria sp. HMSC03D10]
MVYRKAKTGKGNSRKYNALPSRKGSVAIVKMTAAKPQTAKAGRGIPKTIARLFKPLKVACSVWMSSFFT